MMAAEAGAKHVTTCEMVPIVAEEAARIVEKNGFADRVSVVAKRSTSLVVGQDMPDRADVLVSEILSNDFVGEGVVPSFNDAKARLLKPGARVIPARGQIMGALVGGPHIEYLLGLGDVCGFDVSSFAKFKPLRQFVFDLGEYNELSRDVALVSMDFEKLASFAPIDVTVPIEVTAAGRCHGLLQWLQLELSEDVNYDNHPRTTKSIWKPTLYAFADPVDVKPGDRLAVRVWQSRSYICIARA